LVFEFFDRHLAPEWEIYVQPHLNGLRPDFVLLNPDVGIGVFEVKDWDLGACDWRIEDRGGRPTLVGKDSAGRPFVKPSPFERLHAYRKEIAELYCPALNHRAGLAAVTAGLIFPLAQEVELLERFEAGLTHRAPDAAARHYFTLTGASALEEGKIELVFPDHARQNSQLMSAEIAGDLRHWLVEPDFAAEQRAAPRLSRDQLRYVSSRTETGFRRLRGPAGSGKTMVLAGRASALAAEGKDVLVVSFNITLLNYLRDCSVLFGGSRNDVTWLNFHAWCKRVLYGAGMEDVYKTLPWREANDRVLDDLLPAAVAAVIENQPGLTDKYDAILVDEGQDFRPSWWDSLRKVLRRNGEMLLIADRAQDVYGRNDLWTEQQMEGAGFRGPWATLDVSYRMPSRLAELTSDFVEQFLTDGEIAAPVPFVQQELDVEPATLRWIQTDPARLPEAAIEAIRASMLGNGHGGASAAFADVVFLCDRKEVGRSVVGLLSGLGISVIHTYAVDGAEERRQKMFFFKGDAKVKATTIHSFKGWEGRHLVLAAGGGSGQRALSAVYTGMTRLKAHPAGSHLTVVSAAPELESFGRTWPHFERIP
jgi:hypothetical protein